MIENTGPDRVRKRDIPRSPSGLYIVLDSDETYKLVRGRKAAATAANVNPEATIAPVPALYEIERDYYRNNWFDCASRINGLEVA